LKEKVLAIQTTRKIPDENDPLQRSGVYTNSLSQQNANYQSFNLGMHVGDCANNVANNRLKLQLFFPENAAIQWLEQVHGNVVATIDEVSDQPLVADAIITRQKNIVLAVMTADCLPILLTNEKGDEIAAIHGGWRPLANNIIANSVNKMNSDNSHIYAWLGPCIGPKVFEVGHDVKTVFKTKSNDFSAAFTQQANGKYLADLQMIAQLQLQQLGVKRISKLPECTYTNNEKYYSYRKQQVTGRMATLICRY
ncbi:MAG: peptidoglycan editing factor PgeF, partial [Colwellia sp.]